jgi:hypothetical protein
MTPERINRLRELFSNAEGQTYHADHPTVVINELLDEMEKRYYGVCFDAEGKIYAVSTIKHAHNMVLQQLAHLLQSLISEYEYEWESVYSIKSEIRKIEEGEEVVNFAIIHTNSPENLLDSNISEFEEERLK